MRRRTAGVIDVQAINGQVIVTGDFDNNLTIELDPHVALTFADWLTQAAFQITEAALPRVPGMPAVSKHETRRQQGAA